MTLFAVFPDSGQTLPRHYGRVARAMWHLTDAVFKAADSPHDCPPGFSAKSVQVADVYERPAITQSRTVFITLWYHPREPVLVACPEIPPVLLKDPQSMLADTRAALQGLVWQITERLNLVAPVARSLAAGLRSP